MSNYAQRNANGNKPTTENGTRIPLATPVNRASWITEAMATVVHPRLKDGIYAAKLMEIKDVYAKDTDNGKDFIRLTYKSKDGIAIDNIYEGRFPIFIDQITQQLELDKAISFTDLLQILAQKDITIYVTWQEYEGTMRQNVSYVAPTVKKVETLGA